MIATIRIPTVQFGYIELKVENIIQAQDIITIHNDFVAAYEERKGEIQKLKDDNF